MNIDEVRRYWMDYLESIEVSDTLVSELVKIVAETGNELSVFKIFIQRLSFLQSLGALAVRHKEFESIGDGLFSMHLAGTDFNIRILYSFLPNRQPVLLLAFYERGGKRKTDYTPYKDPALSRLKQIKEEFYHVSGNE